MVTVITYGTFDLFHVGHLNILQRAKALGDYLIVGASTDEFNSIKGKACTYPFDHRRKILESIRFVDKVIPEICWEQKITDIKKYQIDIFVMGSDWKGEFDFLTKYCQVIYLPRTEDISTTYIKDKIKLL